MGGGGSIDRLAGIITGRPIPCRHGLFGASSSLGCAFRVISQHLGRRPPMATKCQVGVGKSAQGMYRDEEFTGVDRGGGGGWG